jgi:hypothetical protein
MALHRSFSAYHFLAIAAMVTGWSSLVHAQKLDGDSTKVDFNEFKDPALEFRGTRWFTWAGPNMTEEFVKAQVANGAASKGAYGGWMFTPDREFAGGARAGGRGGRGARGGRGPTSAPAAAPAPPAAPASTASYLNDEWFRVYRIALEESQRLGFPMRVLYDEMQFPSGYAGGKLKAKYPDYVGKSLDKLEKDVTGPAQVSLEASIQNGTYIGAVRMNLDTLELVDISDQKAGENGVNAQVPAGKWKVMLFYLDPSANARGLVDYLDAKAVDGLIEVMYQPYYDHLKDFFGSMIKMTFFDEPGLQHPEFKGRIWTASFNPEFQKKFGYSPMKYYPALWYDIGPDTQAARNALFGFRADMYAENFIGRIAKWCEAHGVKSSGHLDQEEALSPVSTQGDLMKVFKYEQMPAHDDIFWIGRSIRSYKIMTSSAFNWDKPIAVAETFAAYQGPYQNAPSAYRTVMDQHAMGISFQVGNFPIRNDPQAQLELGTYLGRIQYMLQHGRHVADIGVVYPIAAMQGAYRFAEPAAASTSRGGRANANFYYALEGGIVPPEIDYMDLGEMLFLGFKMDYTFLHPEIIDERCSVEGNKLVLNNKENREEYRVIILPGGDTINLAVAKKLQAFYRAGGKIIATSKLPTKAAELGKDAEVQAIMDELFGMPQRGPMTAELRSNTDLFKIWFSHPNDAGGIAMFLPRLDNVMLEDALNLTDPTPDVAYYSPGPNGQMARTPPALPVKLFRDYDGNLSYIHKVKDGKDIYFFANSTDNPVDTQVVLRGEKKLSMWNPHTGERSTVEAKVSNDRGESVTTVQLKLDPIKSVFYVSE